MHRLGIVRSLSRVQEGHVIGIACTKDVAAPDPQLVVVVDGADQLRVTRDLGHVGALRDGQRLEAACAFAAIVPCDILVLSGTERLQLSVRIGTRHPNVVVLLRAPDLLRLLAFGHAELVRVVFIVLVVVATLGELTPEHVARRVDFAILSHNGCEVLSATDVDHFVSILDAEIVVTRVMELIEVIRATTSHTKHVLTALTEPV